MPDPESLLIFGASTRAAAFSALRAGLRPWCADLFADADLQARVPVRRLTGRYPDGFLDLIRTAPHGTWMYTGGMENRSALVGAMALHRPLWGNGESVLRPSRSPFDVVCVLREAQLPFLDVLPGGDSPPRGERWLVKPLAGVGGLGVRPLDSSHSRKAAISATRTTYLQRFKEGDSRSALFVGDGRHSRLLGVTQQLVGRPWLHARPFQYCGSIGPLPLASAQAAVFRRLGDALTSGFGLRGLFGIDGIWDGVAFWPVEVNPRYTASVEVVEHATGMRALAWHAAAFAPGLLPRDAVPPARDYIGKAILFARAELRFPSAGPWTISLNDSPSPEVHPAFADIPPAGTAIGAGQPVLTFFARKARPEGCEEALRRLALDLDRRLFP